MKHYLLMPHSETCSAIKLVQDGRWNTPWCCPKEERIKSKKLGKKGQKLGKRGRPSDVYCLVFKCNDPDCPAELAIEMKNVLETLDLTEKKGGENK